MEGMSNAFKKVMESEEENKKRFKHHPPDGGWGWVIVATYALQNVILLPILINFGLMFRDVFIKLKLNTTDSSIIINVNSAAGLLFGLLNGPLLKTFGFRKIACLGALLTFIGNSLTSFATSFYEFIIYYGIISSIGVALVMSSFSLALNTYFVERRGIATGIAMSFTGLGPIFMPLFISKLMTIYGGRGTALIMAGLTLHSFAGALLLHPVKWHYRKINQDMELVEKEPGKDTNVLKMLNEKDKRSSENISLAENIEDDTLSDGDLGKTASVRTNFESNSIENLPSSDNIQDVKEVDTMNNVDKKKIYNGGKYDSYNTTEKDKAETETFLKVDSDKYNVQKRAEAESVVKNEIMNNKSLKSRIVELFDLDLLREPIFRNIWIGMSIAFTAEMNFTLMTPFILGDMGYNTYNTAKIMSIMGTADILTRFLSPFIGQRTKLPARYLYLISLCILVIFRFGLTVVETESTALLIFIGLGIGKGFRAIYHSLVIPNHVPLEKLPSASGLQTVLNGIFLMSFGPILGYIKDTIGNFNSYIHVLNVLTITTIILWIIEFIYRACKHTRE